MRLPPNVDPNVATKALIQKLTTDVPYNAKITIDGDHKGQGFCMKTPETWVSEAIDSSAVAFFDG